MYALLFLADGTWSLWSSWSTCSPQCGKGTQKRTRSCKVPKSGGQPCEGPPVQKRSCGSPCNGKKIDSYWQEENSKGGAKIQFPNLIASSKRSLCSVWSPTYLKADINGLTHVDRHWIGFWSLHRIDSPIPYQHQTPKEREREGKRAKDLPEFLSKWKLTRLFTSNSRSSRRLRHKFTFLMCLIGFYGWNNQTCNRFCS